MNSLLCRSSTTVIFYLEVKKTLQKWCLDEFSNVSQCRLSSLRNHFRFEQQSLGLKTLSCSTKDSISRWKGISNAGLHSTLLTSKYSNHEGCQCRRCFSDVVTNLSPAAQVENYETTANCVQTSNCNEVHKNGCDCGVSLTEEEMHELTSSNPKLLKKFKLIQLEYLKLRDEGCAPSKLTLKHWKNLLEYSSPEAFRKYFNYLLKTEWRRLRSRRQKEKQRLNYADNPKPHVFLRVFETNVNNYYHSRMCSAILHSSPLVLDCSYDDHMSLHAVKNCAKQIARLIKANRTHSEPFNLYLCNANRKSNMMEHLQSIIPTIYEDSYVINLHQKSFMELLPKERLVYLTPYARDTLEEYNEDDIYIIGACVTKTKKRHWSLEKANSLGLRARRLPLDRYLMGVTSSKPLSLNEMLKILLDLRFSRGDWRKALQHVTTEKFESDFENSDCDHNEDLESQTSLMFETKRREVDPDELKDFELIYKRKGFKGLNIGS